MLRTRLWMGAVLIAVTVGVVIVDARLGAYAFLFLLIVLALAWLACFELLRLLPARGRPPAWLCYLALAAVILANLPAHLAGPTRALDPDPWHWIVSTFAAVVLLAFLVEMATFREPGESVLRIALVVWIAAYLGLLPSFLAQLRWPTHGPAESFGAVGILSLALAIFVPKSCDTGAYFTGRLFGRHRMAPVLSPKKSWEGAAGGLVISALAAVGIDRLGPVPALADLRAELGFGLTVGLAGLLGDLAESLIKRDCRQKDASQAVPGFGGVLDVVDSVIFAAPVAYWWLG